MARKKQPKNSYSDEFKAEAVALVTEQGYTIAKASRSLGTNDNLIGRWRVWCKNSNELYNTDIKKYYG